MLLGAVLLVESLLWAQQIPARAIEDKALRKIFAFIAASLTGVEGVGEAKHCCNAHRELIARSAAQVTG